MAKYIKSNDGLINLVSAIMELARKDAECKDDALATEAKEYIEMMQKAFS